MERNRLPHVEHWFGRASYNVETRLIRGLTNVSRYGRRERADQTYRFKDVEVISTSLIDAGGGQLPGIIGGVCVTDDGGAYPWEPLTGVLEASERIPLALRDASISPRLADKEDVEEC